MCGLKLLAGFLAALVSAGLCASAEAAPAGKVDAAVRTVSGFNFRSLRQAVADLTATFRERYPRGPEFATRLEQLEAASAQALAAPEAGGELSSRIVALAAELNRLREEALLANPLLDFDRLLVVKRAVKPGVPRFGHPSDFYGHYPLFTAFGRELALPQNHHSLAGIPQTGWDNEIAVLSPVRPEGRLATLYRPEDTGYIGEVELQWDARRLLFTMARGGRYAVYEINANGTGLRQVTPDDQPDVDNFDAAYLPDGKVIFCGTASYQSVPCWNGLHAVPNLYSINADGSGMRQLTFDQDEVSSPVVLNTGQVLYSRWQYTNTTHVFGHILFQMNPDGTSQREFYGSNSYWPNGLYFARGVPGHPTRVAAVNSGYHGDSRMGELLILDIAKGRYGDTGIVQQIPGYGKAVEARIEDRLTSGSWPKFLNPYPLGENYFLVSAKVSPDANWAIYLVDVFDNMLLLHADDGYALLEPVPVRKHGAPPVVPDKVDLRRRDGIVYMHDVYAGPGLKGVPRGAVKRLRVHSYHFAYLGFAGLDKVGIEGPWDVMRILGTVPVDPDGSALFRAPANTAIAVQPLDERGRALQVMRSWFTLMPGEVRSCVGCHEPQNTVADVKRTTAATREPSRIAPWYGPPRGFDFEREVQPVLTRYCAGCHDGTSGRPDLRSKQHFPAYEGVGSTVPAWWSDKLPQIFSRDYLGSKSRKSIKVQFTPAYEALQKYVYRNGPEGDYMLPNAGEFYANTSELVQILEKGHYNVKLDPEAWDRLITWIDLNVPCHGTWGQILPIPFSSRQRRLELAKLYAGMETDPEEIPDIPAPPAAFIRPEPDSKGREGPDCPGWPFDIQEARERQRAAGYPAERVVELVPGIKLTLVLIPSGGFLMGDGEGAADERPVHRARIAKPFWMGAFEVTNEQYALFDPSHDSGYMNDYNKISIRPGRGYALNERGQPVVRVPQERAAAFCAWLSEKTGRRFRLPSEAEWEWAARAGKATRFSFGGPEAAFQQWANMADQSIRVFYENARGGHSIRRTTIPGNTTLKGEWMIYAETENDGSMVTAPVATYLANPWGLYDVHGNAAEWTLSDYSAYPGGREINGSGRKVVRGGSWSDRPYRCRSAFRWGYPSWQPVYNVGFRVVAEID